ncbi:uncharacterized protein LOC5510896 [Nematostella vectensis]|uniref:uncharacterized protein LOC5510896 n=1 Tax=Nematostella vectensis TaxID=45351 RepID=UPI002076FF47|nr:uncharacterized protein LOC5510896 [Nematostella vectensis]
MADLREDTLCRIERFRKHGYEVVLKWECEFKDDLDESVEMREYVDGLAFDTPIDPRDSFFGGRTNSTCLFKEVEDGERIDYVDFTSLYPSVNKGGEYPIAHPSIYSAEALKGKTSPAEFFRIIKCYFLPPRSLFHPVLPYRAQGKLMFPLCRTCAETLQQSPSNHSNAERMLSGTWCSIELEKACQLGYAIKRMSEVWHFEQRSSELFTCYFDTFLKLKQQASGWPVWCETESDKDQYIRDYEEKEGIKLEWGEIKKNPGLRSLAKLMLNSFWGKFGQRNKLTKVELVTESKRFFKLLGCRSNVVKNVQMVNEESLEVYYAHGEEFIESAKNTNVVIASFTTAIARLKLYSVLESLQERVLYFDTDSIIYSSKPGDWHPPRGDYLGDLTNDLDEGEYITIFVSGGPKNYGYNGRPFAKCEGLPLTIGDRNN